MEDFWIGSTFYHCKCFKGGLRQKLWGVLLMIGDASEGWEHNGWRVLLIIVDA
jgi:hypothetical protein